MNDLAAKQAAFMAAILDDSADLPDGWGASPMRRRAARSPLCDSPVRSVSFNTVRPEVGSTSRLMHRIRVDLPAPDGPISAIT